MICRNCGAELVDNAVFCAACGQPVAAEVNPEPCAPAVEEYSATPETVQPQWEEGQENPVFSAPAEEKPRRNWKRVILTAAVAVLVLALLSGGVAFALHYFSPEESLARAWENTCDELEAMGENCVTLRKMPELLEQLAEEQAFTMLCNLNVTGEDAGSLSLAYHFRQDATALTAALSVEEMGNDMQIYADREILALSVDGGNRYYLPMENLTQSLAGTELADYLDTETAMRLERYWDSLFAGNSAYAMSRDMSYSEELEAIEDSITIETVEKTIPGAGTLDTVYQFDMDYNTVTKFLCATLKNVQGVDEESQQQMVQMVTMLGIYVESMKPEVLFGVRDGCLVAAQVTVEGESISFLLTGEKNPWSSFTLMESGETIFMGTMAQTASGLSATVDADGDVLFCAVDDAAGTLTFSLDGESVTLNYGCTDREAEFALQIPADGSVIDMELVLEPFTGTAAFDRLGALNLLEVTHEQLMAFLMLFY